MKTWKILEFGKVPEDTPVKVLFSCPNCGNEAELPVVGLAIAQIGSGLVFDNTQHAMPSTIECRACRKRFGDVR